MDPLEQLIGKGFEYGARGPDAYDCYGLAMEVYRLAGLSELPDQEEFASAVGRGLPDFEHIPGGSPEYMAEVNSVVFAGGHTCFLPLDKPEPYAFVTIRSVNGFVSHLGVVLPNLRQFIHVFPKRNVVIDRLDHPLWKQKIEGFYRYAPPPETL